MDYIHQSEEKTPFNLLKKVLKLPLMMLHANKSTLLLLIAFSLTTIIYFSKPIVNSRNHQVPKISYQGEKGKILLLDIEAEESDYLSKTGTKIKQDDFLHQLKSLDWTHLSAQSFVDFLIPFSIKEPAATINESCKPEPLPPVNKHLCHVPKTQNIFTGELKELPGKVVHAIKLGYDVDVLEIHLNELYDVIDYFIITESLESHYQQTKKPLIWELVQLQPRFKKFRDKVIHFVLDDADIVMPTPEEGIFGSERLQEKLRWEKLKKWSDRLLLLSDDDVIGFGDADEITNRLNIHRLRYCRLKSSVFDIGSWFAFGELKHAFASDFPVIGHPYTIGNPTYWKFGKAKNFHQSYPTYQRGNSGGYLLGGAHLTHYSYIPYLLIKSLTATEADKSFGKIRSIVEKISSNDINTNSKSVLNLIVRKLDGFMKMVPSTRFVEVQKLVKRESNYAEVMIVPWFLKCNPERYPSWYGHYDDLRLLYS